MKLRDIMIPALKSAFPDRKFNISDPPDPIIVSPADCSEVGDLQIYDDGDEATICIGNITHYHDNPYDEEMSDSDRSKWITENVIEFLRALFTDKLFLWCIDGGKGGGGCSWPFDGNIPDDIPTNAAKYVWSKKIGNTG